MMGITYARQLVGKRCFLQWRDRQGCEKCMISRVHEVMYAPLYGGALLTDSEEVGLSRIVAVDILQDDGSAIPVYGENRLPA